MMVQSLAPAPLLILATIHAATCIAQGGFRGAVRLADGEVGDGYEYGRLEVFANGTWGAVCDMSPFAVPGFTTKSAQVACTSLGYGGGAPLRFLQPRFLRFTQGENAVLVGNLPVLLSEVNCRGNEDSILDCPARRSDFTDCELEATDGTDATVVACTTVGEASDCPTPTPEEGSLRLRGGVGTPCDPLHSGFVEVYHRGEWGGIQNELGTLVADVACRQLGFPHGTELPMDSVSMFSPDDPESPSLLNWLDRIDCRGPEERLVECDLRRGFLRTPLVRTPVQPNIVVCRQFAVEAALESVVTPGAVEGDVRMVEETTGGPWVSGRLEVFFEGSWSQVCALGFDGVDADVACRQLGYGAGTANSARARSFRSSDERVQAEAAVFAEVGLTLVGCTGTETSILQCPGDDVLEGFRSRGCNDVALFGLFLSCVANPIEGQEGALRMVDRTVEGGRTTGIVEVFHAGAWGSVCDGRRMAASVLVDRSNIVPEIELVGITEAAGDVICHQLGFNSGTIDLATVSDRTSPPWVGEMECTGFEAGFSECDNVLFGDTQECEETQLSVTCSVD